MGVERPITVNNLLPEMDKYGYMSLVIRMLANFRSLIYKLLLLVPQPTIFIASKHAPF